MDLRPSAEQQQLIDSVAALYAKESSTERVRAAEPLGLDRRLWDQLLSMGVLAMAVGDEHGGWGATLLDLALVAEQHGRSLGSAPLIETQVAARLLARVDQPAAATALTQVLNGDRLVTFAPHPTRRGRATAVPAGAIATDVVVMAGDDLVLVPIGDDRVVTDNTASMPLADIAVSGGELLSMGQAAQAAFDAAIDDWLALTAAALAAIAVRSVEIGVDYTKERHAFGRPIGAFQSIAHGLANAVTDAEAAQLLAREAAWAATDDRGRHPELAALAFGFAAESARDSTYRSLHYHGGYGFMVEYDIQLYYRRARGWARVGMTPAQAFERGARRRYAAELAALSGGGR